VSLPNDPTLKAELCALKYLYRNGLRLIESKDDAKKRGIKSPDFADSLMLTFAEPVIERSTVDLSDYPVDY
jgi:phage terminase large subunit